MTPEDNGPNIIDTAKTNMQLMRCFHISVVPAILGIAFDSASVCSGVLAAVADAVSASINRVVFPLESP